MIKCLKFIKYTTIFLLAVFVANQTQAAMKSNSYIIYETVMHSFDGPIISNVSHSVSGINATVTWDTNIVADNFVIYDTDSNFLTSKEQGSSVKNTTSHSVTLTGLNANTIYYYKVRSERINSGITTDSTARNFTTGSAGDEEESPSGGGGGGILVIDKTDKDPPNIANVVVKGITSDAVEMSWDTDEPATSFVEYGQDRAYGATYGQWASTTEHAVTLINLESDIQYHFRILSSDSWGNVGYSDDQIFTTTAGVIEEELLPEEEVGEEGIIADTTQRVMDFIGRLFPQISISDLGPDGLAGIDSPEELYSFIPAPVLSGLPRVEIGATEATIFWTTDIGANSLVAIAPEDKYNPSASEPYLQVVGNTEIQTTSHEVTVYGLIPDTTYHYQLRSKANLGPMARSMDHIFRTSIEELQITSFFTQVVDNETAVFKWITNKESDSAVRFAPYRGNVLNLDLSKTVKDNAMSIIHEITVNEFEAGTYYNVELVSIDDKGNIATEALSRFSTSEDDLPPIISHIKADSTVFLDRSDKIQTIISWLTNESATSRVYYQEGVHGSQVDLSEVTNLNTNYTKEHVMVITKFKPGIVYSFRVESIDSGGNVTLSKVHTFMTAKKKESIIQVIMRILEETFSWMKKIM